MSPLNSYQVADRIGVSERQVRRYVEHGRLRCRAILGTRRLIFLESDVQRFLDTYAYWLGQSPEHGRPLCPRNRTAVSCPTSKKCSAPGETPSAPSR